MRTTRNRKYKAPERVYYNLEQASRKISNLCNEEITTDDLIYYWLYGKLEISIPIFINKEFIKIANLYEYERNKFIFLEYSRLLSYIDNPLNIEIEENIERTEFIIKQDDITLFDKCPINRNTIFYTGFFSISPYMKSIEIEGEISKNGIFINYLRYLTSPKDKYGKRLKFYTDFSVDFDNTRNTYIPKDRLYILDYALYDFLNNHTEFKIIAENMQKPEPKTGRPTKITEEFLELGRKTAQEYPTASANNIANAIYAHLTKQGIKLDKVPTALNLQKAYRANGIGASEEKIDRNLIIDKIPS